MTDTSKSFARETLDEIRSKLTDANAAACGMIEQSTKRQHFTDVRYVTVRWEPYKPDGARQMKAKGRWQEQVGSGDYFRWANCDRPAFAHDPETIEDLRAQLAAANARADQARDAALVEALSACKQVAETAREYSLPQMVMGANKCHDDISDLRIHAHAILAIRDKPAPAVTVQDAARVLLSDADAVLDLSIEIMRNRKPNNGNVMGYQPAIVAALRAIAGGGDE